jgi:hypothetical protein
VGEYIRKPLVENGELVMSLFSVAGGYGEAWEAVGAGTYMIVFKRFDLGRMRCVPVSLSTRRRKLLRSTWHSTNHLARAEKSVKSSRDDEKR